MTNETGNVPDRANMAAKTTYNIPPPSYKNASSYDHYKTLLSAWAEYTDVPKAKQGYLERYWTLLPVKFLCLRGC